VCVCVCGWVGGWVRGCGGGGGGGGGGGRGGGGCGGEAAASAAASAVSSSWAAAAAVEGRERERHYPHPPGLPIRWMCGKVHRDLSDAIGPIAATYAPFAGCSVWN
jgi:hypothetical protein